MSEQPEALRLADELCAPVPDYPAPTSLEEAAAAELRRLYQLAQEQHTVIYGLRLEVCNLLKAKVEAMFNPPAQPATEESSATQPAPVQPVAWVNHGENRITRATGWDGYGALYTTPPAQPAPVQEPVAQYSDIVSDGGLDPRNKFDIQPAAQRQWVGLTDEEIHTEWALTPQGDSEGLWLGRRVEAKLKEKNT